MSYVSYVSYASFLAGDRPYACIQWVRGDSIVSLMRISSLSSPSMFKELVVLLLVIGLITSEFVGPHCQLLNDREIRPSRKESRCRFDVDCRIDKWRQRVKPSRLIVLSYGHNGFGNQIFQHTFGYLTAKSLKAVFYADTIALNYTPDHRLPHNTGGGSALMDKILPNEFKYYLLPQDHDHRRICEAEPEILGDRPRDHRQWKEEDFQRKYSKYFTDLLTDTKPRCLKITGFFQYLPYCFESIKVCILLSYEIINYLI